MLEQAVHQATSKDYDNVVSAMNAIQVQMWICMVAVFVLFIMVTYFIRTGWEDVKVTLKNLDAKVQEHENKFSFMEGEGTATSKFSEEMDKASMRIAGAIERKYTVKARN